MFLLIVGLDEQVWRPAVLPGLVELDHTGLLLALLEPPRARVDGGACLPAADAPRLAQVDGVAPDFLHFGRAP